MLSISTIQYMTYRNIFHMWYSFHTFGFFRKLTRHTHAAATKRSWIQLYHVNCLTEKLTLHHHCIAHHCQQVSQLQEIIRHAKKHPNWYHTYQLTLIQTQVCQILLRQTHLTHLTPGILKEDNARVINIRETNRNNDPIKNCARLIANLVKATYNSKAMRLKLEKDPLHHWVYFLTFINSLLIVLSQFKQNCMCLWTIHP